MPERKTRRARESTLLPSNFRQETLSWKIVGEIRAALFANMVHSGDFLGTESSLAESFGVSRMAVRDALRSLAAIGVVTIRPGKNGGAWIAGGDADHFADALAIQLKLIGITREEMIDAQGAIELRAVELAAERATDSDLDHMQALLAEMAQRLDDPPECAAVSVDFHAAIVAASHNRALIAQFQALRHVLQPAYVEGTRAATVRGALIANRKIFAAIAARDVSAARELYARRIAIVRKGFPSISSKPRSIPS